MSSASAQWWSSLKLWEQYTLGFSGLVLLVLLLAFVKLLALRRAKIYEDRLEAERARIYKLHPEILEKRIGTKGSDVPFGVRALEVGVVVEGVWTSQSIGEKALIRPNEKDDVKVSVLSAPDPSMHSGCTTPSQIFGIEEATVQNILPFSNHVQHTQTQQTSPLLDPEAGRARQAALDALNGQTTKDCSGRKAPRSERVKSAIEDRPFRYHSPNPTIEEGIFWSGTWFAGQQKPDDLGISHSFV